MYKKVNNTVDKLNEKVSSLKISDENNFLVSKRGAENLRAPRNIVHLGRWRWIFHYPPVRQACNPSNQQIRSSLPPSKGPKHKYLHPCARRQLNQKKQPEKHDAADCSGKKSIALFAVRSQKIMSAPAKVLSHLLHLTRSAAVCCVRASKWYSLLLSLSSAWQRPHGKQKQSTHSQPTANSATYWSAKVCGACDAHLMEGN